jgi:hypothetical protein
LTFRTEVYVWIKQFLLDVGGTQLNFGVERMESPFKVESREGMESRIRKALEDWFTVTRGHERLISALHYYRHARRLSELQPDRVALTAEILLNLTKALEILLTSDRETARGWAREWGFTERQIEQWIIPLFLLRSKVDVAHPSWGPLTDQERKVVLSFKGAALERVGIVLTRVFDEVNAGRIQLDPVRGSLDADRRKLLTDIAEYIRDPDSEIE